MRTFMLFTFQTHILCFYQQLFIRKPSCSDDPLMRIRKQGHAMSIDGTRFEWLFDHSAVDGIMFLDQFVVSEDVFRQVSSWSQEMFCFQASSQSQKVFSGQFVFLGDIFRSVRNFRRCFQDRLQSQTICSIYKGNRNAEEILNIISGNDKKNQLLS